MSRSATLPSIRVTPETKDRVEAVLRAGESLPQFIKNAVCREAEVRAVQQVAAGRATTALLSADKGIGLMTADDFLRGMEHRAEAARSRIREAVEARNKRTTR